MYAGVTLLSERDSAAVDALYSPEKKTYMYYMYRSVDKNKTLFGRDCYFVRHRTWKHIEMSVFEYWARFLSYSCS